jgi:hypothetical protein
MELWRLGHPSPGTCDIRHLRLLSMQSVEYGKITQDHAGATSEPPILMRLLFFVGNNAHDRTCLSRVDQNYQVEALGVLARRRIAVSQRAPTFWIDASQ